MHQHRPLAAVGLLERAHHGSDVVAVDGAHVGEAQFFEHRSHLRHRQSPHAFAQAAQLGGDLAVQEGEVAHGLLGTLRKELHRRAEPHAVQVVGEGPHRGRDRHVVVVQHHQQAGAGQMAGVVDGFEGHAAGEGPVTDDGHAFVGLAQAVAGHGHAKGRRDARGGVPGTEMIEAALAALQISGDAPLLAQGVETAVATGHQLVGVGLVPHIPDDAILVQVKGLVQGQGQFHHPEPGTEVTTAGGHGFEMLLADLPGDCFEFRGAETVQLVGMAQLAEVHALGSPAGRI